jgi:hypothetical protein
MYTAKVRDACGAEDKVVFTWTLIETSNPLNYANITANILPPKVQNQLSIPENTLLPGYYYDFQVMATSGSLSGSATIRLTTEASALVVKIDKANGSVSDELDLVIDGSTSYDPNGLAKTIYFIWSCLYEDTSKICEDTNGNSLIQIWDQSILTIPSTSLVGGKSLKFILTITNDYDKRSSSTSVVLKVLAGLSTNLNIIPPEGLVEPSYSIEIIATVTSKTTYDLKWTMLEGPEGIKIEHDYIQVLMFKANTLPAGYNYIFQLTATEKDSKNQATAQVEFKTNTAAVCYSPLTITPSSGIALVDTFNNK